MKRRWGFALLLLLTPLLVGCGKKGKVIKPENPLPAPGVEAMIHEGGGPPTQIPKKRN